MAQVLQKSEAHRLVDRMPVDATWDDLMHEIYVREVIEKGLAESRAGRARDAREVRAKYSLGGQRSIGPRTNPPQPDRQSATPQCGS